MPQEKAIASESDFPKFLPVDKKRPLFKVSFTSTKKRFVKYKQTGKISLRYRTSVSALDWIDGKDEIEISEDLLMPHLEIPSTSKSVNVRSNAIHKI